MTNEGRLEVTRAFKAAQAHVDALTINMENATKRRDLLAKQDACDHPKQSLTVETMELVVVTCNKCGYVWMD